MDFSKGLCYNEANQTYTEGKTMKVLMSNGSPKSNGNTALALKEMESIFVQQNIDVETVHIGAMNIRGCIACVHCFKNGNASSTTRSTTWQLSLKPATAW